MKREQFVILTDDEATDTASFETADTEAEAATAIRGRRRDFPGERIRVFRGVDVTAAFDRIAPKPRT